MKLSLSWLFDHIDADWRSINVADLVARFNKTTAEIDTFYRIDLPLQDIALARVEAITADAINMKPLSGEPSVILPVRSDISSDASYFIIKQDGQYRWALSTDFGADKEFIMGAMQADQSWASKVTAHDWIIEVDNKSINHRSDLWCHRGIARECAAILQLPLKAIYSFIAPATIDNCPVHAHEKKLQVSLEQVAGCDRYAALPLTIKNSYSDPFIAARLARIDSRAINAAVDLTNYVMFDMGQPMHAFDAAKLGSQKIVVRQAKNKEKITLLDGQTVELAPQDILITNGSRPIALAGIMGGADTAVDVNSHEIILESAHFDAGIIRKTAAHVKKRTDASTRFEKTLDPFGNTLAIQRFLALAHTYHLTAEKSPTILSLGEQETVRTITVSHAFIQVRLGITIASEDIRTILGRLSFGVTEADGIYTVTIPSFRVKKDMSVPEDIVEEIGRFVGYETIVPQLPTRAMAPFGMQQVVRLRALKNVCAFGMGMREVYNYALHDQDFIKMLNWQPEHAAQVLSPVSENWRLLVTSLIPGLLKNIFDNAATLQRLRFFECARTWQTSATTVQEFKKIAGIIYDKEKPVDFYHAKAELDKVWQLLSVSPTYVQLEKVPQPWFMPYQSAQVMIDGIAIGVMGKVNTQLLSVCAPGDAFIFEFDAAFLLAHQKPVVPFKALSKYQPVERDISILVAHNSTVVHLQQLISHADARISAVSLIDVFHKKEWADQKAITFRFVITDHEKTISKEESEAIWQQVANALKNEGAQIR